MAHFDTAKLLSNLVDGSEEDDDELDPNDPNSINSRKRKAAGIPTRRKSKACDACHRLKAKCAGDQPCQRCSGLGEQCTYDRPSRRRGPKVAPELSASKRLKSLEALVRERTQQGIQQLLSNVPFAENGAPGALSPQPYFYPNVGYPYDPAFHISPNRYASGTVSSNPSDEFSAANIIHGLSRSSSGYGGGPQGDDVVMDWALPPPHVLHHLAVSMVARETFPTISQAKLLRLIAAHGQAPPGTRPPSIIPASAALGAYQLSRIPNPNQPESNANVAGMAAHYQSVACQLINISARCIEEEINGEGYGISDGMFARKGKDADKLTVLSCIIIQIILSSSTHTMRDADFYDSLALKLALKLKLNRETSEPTEGEAGDAWIEREESRRIWWMIFCDSAIMPAWDNQPTGFTEEDVEIHLPCPDPLFSDPLLPPPDPIPFQLAFRLLTPLGSAASPRSRSSSIPTPLTNFSPPGSSGTEKDLRSLFHSGRTGISGYTALLHGIAYRIMRLKRIQSFFVDGPALEACSNEEKNRLSGMLDTWYSALPDAVVEADRRAGREGGVEGVEPRSGVLFMLYHTYKVLLYGRWDVISMVYDDAWLMSPDFLLCVEHADRVTRLIELVTKPVLADDGTFGRGAAEMMRWANPYVIGVAVLMGSFVHAAVLRKLRLVNPGLYTSGAGNGKGQSNGETLETLEKTLIRKIELHISLVETLANKWGLKSGLWALMREELIHQKPDLEPSKSAFFKLDYGPGGKGLVGSDGMSSKKKRAKQIRDGFAIDATVPSPPSPIPGRVSQSVQIQQSSQSQPPTPTQIPREAEAPPVFTVILATPETIDDPHIQLNPRILMPLGAMRAARLKAGDIVVVSLFNGSKDNERDPVRLDDQMLDSGKEGHSGQDTGRTILGIAIAWPSFTISDIKSVSLPVHLRLALPTPNQETVLNVSIEAYARSVVEATHVKIQTPDGVEVDATTEAYIRTVLISFRHISTAVLLKIPIGTRAVTMSLDQIEPKPLDAATLTAYTFTSRTLLTFGTHDRMVNSGSVACTVPSLMDTAEDSDDDNGIDAFASVGGLDEQVRKVREVVEGGWASSTIGLRPPTGILLHGPPGTGKTVLARALAKHLQSAMSHSNKAECSAFSDRPRRAHFVHLNAPEVLGRFVGQAEQTLRSAFDRARWGADGRPPSDSPSLAPYSSPGGVLFIDELDALAPSRDSVTASDVDRRVVGALLTLMDGLGAPGEPQVVVVAATNRPGSIDPALRRAGRFDVEVEIGVPDERARLQILRVLLANVPNNVGEIDLKALAARAHGYVGADLAGVVREAGTRVVRDVAKGVRIVVELSAADLEVGMKVVGPSSMREVALEVPHVPWSSIAGQHTTKLRLREAVEWPLRHPQAFLRMGIRPPRGVLLYGPPGCSKTLMAKALATETGVNFMAVKGPEVMSMWVGESEKRVREVFERARKAGPAIVFFDEIDSIATRRTTTTSSSATTRVLSQLLVELDGISPLSNVTVVAATNRPDAIDPALLRPGRIDRMCYVGPPDLEARAEIFRMRIRGMKTCGDVNLAELVSRTNGYSGAECVAVCQEAAMAAMEENVDATEVCWRHFLSALEMVPSRITKEMLNFYDEFRQKSGLKSVD
ncbi:spermatogenesis associated protein 5 [Gonapodya sp. JEL0774]|nr:spermatogenesis associated protein 5 [Gonapodya sp. JEL0774]